MRRRLAGEPAGGRLRDAGRREADPAGGGQPAAHGERAHHRTSPAPRRRSSSTGSTCPRQYAESGPHDRRAARGAGTGRRVQPPVRARRAVLRLRRARRRPFVLSRRRRRTPGRSCSRTIRPRARVATIRASARRWICTIAASPRDWPAARATTVDLSARRVALPYGPLQLDVDPSGFAFGGYQLVDFTSLADFEIRGLRNRYRHRGIGAPLAASVSKGEGRVDPWIGPRVKVPVTALLRFDDPRRGMSDGALHGTIEVFDADESATTADRRPHRPAGVREDGRARLSARRVRRSGTSRSPASAAAISASPRADDNLFMLQPYRPGRIPVVFVHGTASSPARWAEMANELMNDPVLGQRYQFWFFLYNTGNPVAYSAMGLREALQHVVADGRSERHGPGPAPDGGHRPQPGRPAHQDDRRRQRHPLLGQRTSRCRSSRRISLRRRRTCCAAASSSSRCRS